MALAEWEEMENRSQEAWTMASSLQYEPLIARCHFFLGIAYYGQEKWTRARDAFEFANPCVGVYVTAGDLELWRQNVHTASEAAHADSIESVPNRLSRRHGKNRGWEDLGNIVSAGSIHSVELGSNRGRASTGELSSGSSSPESAIESLPKRSFVPNEVSTRQLLGRILPPFPFLFPTSDCRGRTYRKTLHGIPRSCVLEIFLSPRTGRNSATRSAPDGIVGDYGRNDWRKLKRESDKCECPPRRHSPQNVPTRFESRAARRPRRTRRGVLSRRPSIINIAFISNEPRVPAHDELTGGANTI
ncbi:hypothetical protein MMC07_002533, partial [Pseudocyphellaria aurata]|nr:hypothetical protein [Pseudocyphellaria aurata]